MKVLTVLGARPQFIKAAPVSNALREAGHTEYLVHTGQHYDFSMSQVFFDEMNIPAPDINLEIGSGTHGEQTGKMLASIEAQIVNEQPDCVLVYGDTNSTLAGALAACKLCVPLAHVEAGLRSFNRSMPEEHNRVLTDHCSDLLFCPTQTAVGHLEREGISRGVHLVGDTMYDAVLQFGISADQKSTILQKLGLSSKEYLLATIHRPYNVDDPIALRNILSAFAAIEELVVFPVHPRTRKRMVETIRDDVNSLPNNVTMIEPVGYLDMLMLEQNSRLILTDSGGVQKEAFFFGVPCITLRPETEWVETINAGWNRLVAPNSSSIIGAIGAHNWPQSKPAKLFGDGKASQKIVEIIEKYALI